MARSKPPQHREPSSSWEQEQKQKDQQAAAFTKAVAARGEGRQDGGKQRWTPWLLIRYSLADHGGRPTNDPFWMSPDIWVESSDPSGNAVAGEQNFVHVRIFNLGTVEAAPVELDFYWGNPALGLSAANMNLIGQEWVKVRPISMLEVRCNTPWIPVVVNGGHECLMINSSNYILDPILYPFEPTLDRHVGQRNVTVVQASAGSEISFRLQIHNAWPIATPTQILARTEHVAVAKSARGLTRRSILDAVLAYGNLDKSAAQAAENQAPNRLHRDNPVTSPPTGVVYGARENSHFMRSSPALSAKISEESAMLYPTGPSQRLANLLLARDAQSRNAGTFADFALQELTLKAFEQRTLSLRLEIPADAKPGEFVVFNFAQIAEGFTTGGYAIVAEISAN